MNAAARTPEPTPWSFGAKVNDFGFIKDVEGRPLYENRAPAIMKEGVPMKMRRCPYEDERKGKMMNVSALAQITEHMDAALADVSAFHAGLPASPASWGKFCAALLDQLGQCALFVLRSDVEAPELPAHLSVGYKVAAGYLVPTRELMSKVIEGSAPPVTVDDLRRYVRARNSLVGAREVCAAPLRMVDRVTESFMFGWPKGKAVASAERVLMAHELTQQMWLGLLWKHLDLRVERWLLCDALREESLEAKTPHVARLLRERREYFGLTEPLSAASIPRELDADLRETLESALTLDDGTGRDALVTEVCALVRRGEGALRVQDASKIEPVMRRFVSYLQQYAIFTRSFDDVEHRLRTRLGFGDEAPIRRDATLFPSPRALAWFEMLTGHRVRPVEAEPRRLSLRGLGTTLELDL